MAPELELVQFVSRDILISQRGSWQSQGRVTRDSFLGNAFGDQGFNVFGAGFGGQSMIFVRDPTRTHETSSILRGLYFEQVIMPAICKSYQLAASRKGPCYKVFLYISPSSGCYILLFP